MSVAYKQTPCNTNATQCTKMTSTVYIHAVYKYCLADCTFGIESPIPTPPTPETQSGQLFDLNHPAICTGNLTAWHFCYYTATVALNQHYSLWFRVWRPNRGNRFIRIDQTVVQMSAQTSNDGSSTICEDFTLAESAYIPVMEGDVLAVYVPFTVSTVSVISRGVNGSDLFIDDRSMIDMFQATSVRRRDTSPAAGLAIQVYADIQAGSYQ